MTITESGVTGSSRSIERGQDGRRRVVVRIADREESAMTTADANLIALGAANAREQGIPFVCELRANGPAAAEELAVTFAIGAAAKALTACSGRVPLIGILHGDAVAGPALLLGLMDHVVVVDHSHAFVSGPAMVSEFTGVDFNRTELGGASVLATQAGLAALSVADLDAANAVVDDLLSVLPANNEEPPPFVSTSDPMDRPVPHAGEIIPDTPTGAYDVRDVITEIVDDGWFLEVRESFASNLVTGFGVFGGLPVGIVANQPMAIAGTLDIPSSQKGGRFVAFCDAFNLPLVTLVDTSGFYPGKDLEWRGMIRYGAQLAFAYARATVPRVNVTLRKSYGGAYIVMDSKNMGNDLAFAWPSAEIAVMGAKGAVEILHRTASAEERVELESAYEERLLNPYIAAQRGTVDSVISPESTRTEIAHSLHLLASKREVLPKRKHDNTPL
ncbi:MAG: acetyl-CoA carboxylase carboxyltransferase component [Verrucomicrobiales bacterium]